MKNEKISKDLAKMIGASYEMSAKEINKLKEEHNELRTDVESLSERFTKMNELIGLIIKELPENDETVTKETIDASMEKKTDEIKWENITEFFDEKDPEIVPLCKLLDDLSQWNEYFEDDQNKFEHTYAFLLKNDDKAKKHFNELYEYHLRKLGLKIHNII
jgi:chromosome segregation ATPase